MLGIVQSGGARPKVQKARPYCAVTCGNQLPRPGYPGLFQRRAKQLVAGAKLENDAPFTLSYATPGSTMQKPEKVLSRLIWKTDDSHDQIRVCLKLYLLLSPFNPKMPNNLTRSFQQHHRAYTFPKRPSFVLVFVANTRKPPNKEMTPLKMVA